MTSALIFTVLLVRQSVQVEGDQRTVEALSVGKKVFSDKLNTEMKTLMRAARIIGKDDALRQAVFDDSQSLNVSLNNFLMRLRQDNKASLMWLLELDGEVLASAGVAHQSSHFPYFSVIERAENSEWSTTVIAPIEGKLYQLAVVGFFVPVKAPSPSFWIVIGSELGSESSMRFSDLTDLDIYITSYSKEDFWATSKFINISSTTRDTLNTLPHNQIISITLDKERYFGLKVALDSIKNDEVFAILLKSQKKIKKQLNTLNTQLLVIGIVTFFGSLITAVLLSKSVTKPLLNLVNIAQRIGQGDYSAKIHNIGSGELNILADALNAMQQRVSIREKEIQFIAFHDNLTELPNRNAFCREVDIAIKLAMRSCGTFVICVLDFDRFKEINDTLGHHSGDKVLLEFSQRLNAWCQDEQPKKCYVNTHAQYKSDPQKNINIYNQIKVARLGGDEFALLIPECFLIENILDQVHALLMEPIEIERVALEVRASIGVSFYPDHGETSNSLLQTAEVAMYMAKQNVRDVVYYEKSRDHHSMQRLTLIAELRSAIEQGQLALYYQPKLDLSCNKYRFVECLVRWIHPRFGFINPDDFIGYAEQTGTIRDLTRWVVTTAIKQCKSWQTQAIDLRVAVNISALDLVQAEFASWVIAALEEHNLPAECLVLEVTESAIMRDIDLALSSLHALNNYGICLSIDDYGTGYSSMAQLKCLPVRELKIDKAFVLNLCKSNDDLVIVKSTIELGHNMGLKIVAEGVEDNESLDILRSLNCDYAQGFYLSRPMSIEATNQWVGQNNELIDKFY